MRCRLQVKSRSCTVEQQNENYKTCTRCAQTYYGKENGSETVVFKKFQMQLNLNVREKKVERESCCQALSWFPPPLFSLHFFSLFIYFFTLSLVARFGVSLNVLPELGESGLREN